MTIASTPSAVCAGSCAILSAPLSLTNYTWNVGTNTPTITACPLSINLYSIAGTNTLGCPASGTISIPVNPLPVISITSATNALCIGSSISFTATGATSYSLNNVASPPNIVQTPLTNASYTVTGMDANGCVNTASISISVFSLTVIFPQNTAICKGKTVTLSAASPFTYGYNWTDGSVVNPFQNASFTPTITTTYTVIATDVNNCSLSSTVLVTVNPNPTVSATASRSVICKGESVTLTASGAATYTWNGATTGQAITLSPITNTAYVLMGVTAAGCTNSITVLQIVAACTALDEGKITNGGIKIFPNPNNGVFNLTCDSFEKNKTVEIYNTLGSLVKRMQISSENTQIDLSDESNGFYLLQIFENNKAIQLSKIIKE